MNCQKKLSNFKNQIHWRTTNGSVFNYSNRTPCSFCSEKLGFMAALEINHALNFTSVSLKAKREHFDHLL